MKSWTYGLALVAFCVAMYFTKFSDAALKCEAAGGHIDLGGTCGYFQFIKVTP